MHLQIKGWIYNHLPQHAKAITQAVYFWCWNGFGDIYVHFQALSQYHWQLPCRMPFFVLFVVVSRKLPLSINYNTPKSNRDEFAKVEF